MKVRKKTYGNKNAKDNLFTSVTGGRGKSIMDFMETYGHEKPTTYKKNKKGKFKKVKNDKP